MDIYDPQFRERLSRFEDGELDAADAAEIERLVASNPEARGMLAEYERLRELAARASCPEAAALAAAVKGAAGPEIEAHLSECDACRQAVQWTAETQGAAPAEPETAPHAPKRSEEASDLKVTAAAWGISLLIHLCLLIGVGGWVVGRSSGEGAGGLEVGVVSENDASIQPGDAKLPKLKTAPASLTPVQTQPQKIQPIQAIDAGASAGREAIIALDVGGGAAAQAAGGDWSAFSAAGGGGGGSASFFGLQARGKNFVYVVDHSGSMDGPRLLAAKSELIRSISALKRNMSFLVIFFDDQFEVMPGGRLVKATEANKRRYFGWIDRIESGGGTDPAAAMQTALALKPDAIWLLTDGEFDPEACDAIRQANPGARVQIHTIGFQSREGEPLLKRIARENRGQYRFVP